MTFFQSRLFGEFQEKIPGRGKSWFIVKKGNNGKISAQCLVVQIKLPLGFSWLWVPYGPVAGSAEDSEYIFENIERIGNENRAVFARIEPFNTLPEAAWAKIRRARPAQSRYTPQHTLILDISGPEEEILARMKPKGRYNISVAQKNGVEIVKGAAGKDFDSFYKILQKTGARGEFGVHPQYFYEQLLKSFGENAALFLAKTGGGEIIAGIIVIFCEDTATYYYGASDYTHRSLMAPYLLQWEAIREAKRRGMKQYDFLGIAPSGSGEKHPWSGVTEFKRKFGGHEVAYPPAFEIILKPLWHRLYRLIRRLPFYPR